jgi:hypothetical protein
MSRGRLSRDCTRRGLVRSVKALSIRLDGLPTHVGRGKMRVLHNWARTIHAAKRVDEMFDEPVESGSPANQLTGSWHDALPSTCLRPGVGAAPRAR